MAHAAAGADLDVIDVPYLDLEDLSGMVKEAELVRDLGFSGKGCIHPKQISSINEVFTPNDEAVANAKKIITAFKKAETGLVVIDGKLIEKPVLRHMERVLAIASRVSEKKMTPIDYLRRNGQQRHSVLTDNINIYDLASTANRKGNGVDSLDTPNAIVVGKRFKLLAKKEVMNQQSGIASVFYQISLVILKQDF